MSEKPINVNKKRPFSIVHDDILTDLRLSLQARTVLAYLLGRPANWTIYVIQVQKALGISEKVWARARKEMTLAGYYQQRKLKQANGKFCWENLVTDTPETILPTLKTILPKRMDANRVDANRVDAKSEDITKDLNKVLKQSSLHAMPAEKISVESPPKTKSVYQPKGMVLAHGVEVWDPRDAETVAKLVQEFGAAAVQAESIKIAEGGCRPYPSVVEKLLHGVANENYKSNHTNDQSRRQSQGRGRLSPITQLLADHADGRNKFGGRDYEVVDG